MTYTMVKYLIEKGRTTGLRDKLGVLLLGGAISDEQYMELAAMLPEE